MTYSRSSSKEGVNMGIILCGKKVSPNKYKCLIPEGGMSPLLLGAVVRVEDMEGG